MLTKRQKLEEALTAAVATGVTEDQLRVFLLLREQEANLKERNEEHIDCPDGGPKDWGDYVQELFETAYDWAYDVALDEIRMVNDFRAEIDGE